MPKYIALLVSLLVLGGGLYTYMTGYPQAGGWVIFFSLIFLAVCMARLLDLEL